MLSNIKNLIAKRSLLGAFVMNEINSQSAETRLGWFWWLLDPFIMMLTYWILVGKLFGAGKRWDPYPVFIMCGLLPWKHLSGSLTRSTAIFRNQNALIKSVPFPTMMLPLSLVLSEMVYFGFGMSVLLVTAILWGVPLSFSLVQIPVLMAFQTLIVAGLCIIMSGIGALIRDLSNFMSHLLRVGFYCCPGIYGIDFIRERLGETFTCLYMMNPFSILIVGYRQAVYYGVMLEGKYWAVLGIESILLFFIGYFVFQYYDRRVIKFI